MVHETINVFYYNLLDHVQVGNQDVGLLPNIESVTKHKASE